LAQEGSSPSQASAPPPPRDLRGRIGLRLGPMGQLLSGPVTDKESGDGVFPETGLAWGFSGMQGWRDRMEDSHIAIPSIGAVASGSVASDWNDTALYAVMDGHGGEHVARYCERYLPQELAKLSSKDMGASLVQAFHRMDEMLLDPANLSDLQSFSNDFTSQAFSSSYASPDCMGCTAAVACIRQDLIVVANAGDSRAVLCRKGIAVDMSEDHKPNLPVESRRIHKAGGTVMEQRIGAHTHYRVNGNLNLSRSIGDLGYKRGDLPPQEQMICSTPDIQEFRRQAGDQFMVIACDGIWDVLSSQEVVDYILPRLGNPLDLQQRLSKGELALSSVVEELLDYCLSPDLAQTFGLGGDNMTMVLVVFLGDRGGYGEGWFSSTGHTLSHSSWLCPYK